MKKINLLLMVLLTTAGMVQAQEDNPYRSIGKKGKIVTAYGNRFVEVFDYDSIQRIGTVLFNIHTKKIVKLLDANTTFKKSSDNSAASRWYSVDPLAAKGKNISVSPYAFSMNNPINYVDPDGKDGVRVIDQKNKTITITAVYYVQSEDKAYSNGGKNIKLLGGYSEKQIGGLQKKVNSYLNGLGASVTEGDYKGYKVQFNLQFKTGGDVVDIKKSAASEKIEGNSVGNSFEKGNQYTNPSFKTVETDNGDGTVSTRAVGGQTADHKAITMNVDYDDKMNEVHEIFHTLGFDHPKGVGGSAGIMKYPPDKPNQADINELGNNSFLPVVIKKDE